MIKISVIGDVMSESTLFQDSVAKNPDGTWNYDDIFMPLKGLLSEADYRIANLETPVAGEENGGYSQTIVSFNAPDTLVTALQKIGIDLVSTANNHTTDRFDVGVEETVRHLDALGMNHTGSYIEVPEDRNFYFTVGDTKFAVMAYTYSCNEKKNPDGTMCNDERINTFLPFAYKRVDCSPKPQEYLDTCAFIERLIDRKISWPEQQELRKVMHIPGAYGDDFHLCDKYYKNDAKVREDLAKAKQNADVVLFVPHTGGQFNTQPGLFSNELLHIFSTYGFDAIFAAHSHTTQRAEVLNNTSIFYSLGNVSMSARTVYAQPQTLPNYGIVAHVYVEGKKIVKTAYSLFKIVEEGTDPMRIVPVDELYASLTDEAAKKALEKDVEELVFRIGAEKRAGADAIQREYAIG